MRLPHTAHLTRQLLVMRGLAEAQPVLEVPVRYQLLLAAARCMSLLLAGGVVRAREHAIALLQAVAFEPRVRLGHHLQTTVAQQSRSFSHGSLRLQPRTWHRS